MTSTEATAIHPHTPIVKVFTNGAHRSSALNLHFYRPSAFPRTATNEYFHTTHGPSMHGAWRGSFSCKYRLGATRAFRINLSIHMQSADDLTGQSYQSDDRQRTKSKRGSCMWLLINGRNSYSAPTPLRLNRRHFELVVAAGRLQGRKFNRTEDDIPRANVWN